MEEFVIYLNKFTKFTLFIFILMGITYVFLGISSIINEAIIMGCIQLVIALMAIGLLVINSFDSISNKLQLRLNEQSIFYRDSMILKPKEYFWTELNNVEVRKGYIRFSLKNGTEEQFSLSALNFNEQQFLKEKLLAFKTLIK